MSFNYAAQTPLLLPLFANRQKQPGAQVGAVGVQTVPCPEFVPVHVQVVVPATHVDAACAAVGATSPATKGSAIIVPRPIFLMTSRRERPSKRSGVAGTPSLSFSFFSSDNASHTIS